MPPPFVLQIPDSDLVDLRERLARTRFPDQAPGDPWAYGTGADYLRSLVDYWRSGFDWRAQEARLNAYPSSESPGTTSICTFCMFLARDPTPFPCC